MTLRLIVSNFMIMIIHVKNSIIKMEIHAKNVSVFVNNVMMKYHVWNAKNYMVTMGLNA